MAELGMPKWSDIVPAKPSILIWIATHNELAPQEWRWLDLNGQPLSVNFSELFTLYHTACEHCERTEGLDNGRMLWFQQNSKFSK